MKKAISVILCMVMIMGILPFGAITVYADDSGTHGTLNWSLSSGTLTISGSGEIPSNASWSSYKEQIKKVEIKSGVTSIGNSAFASYKVLTGITIPSSVTSIGSYAFQYCNSLTSISIPSSVTSIGYKAFHYCTALRNVTIPGSIETISEDAFSYCTALTSVIISNGVKTISEDAFYNCTALTSISIPSSVTSIGNSAFYNCSSLTSVTIPSSVHTIGSSAFASCDSLSSVKLSNGIITIGSYAFQYCESLTSISIPSSVTSIGYKAFYYCTALKNATIPGSVETISEDAFSHCSALTSVIISNGVKTISEDAFYNCTALTSISIPSSVTSIGSYAFYDCDSLTSITIPSSVHTIGSSAFSSCDSLASVKLYNGIITIGSYAFQYCESLTSISIPSSVTSIGYKAFYYCTSLTNAKISEDVININEDAFCNCSALTTVHIPKSIVNIYSSAFYGCNNLETVYYGGSRSDWNSIVIGSYNDNLTNANIIYNGGAKPLAITSQPVGAAAAEGATVTASISATGDGLKYEWYFKNPGSSSFTKSSVTSSTYSMTMQKSLSGRKVYCIVTDKYGESLKSDTVSLSIAATITKQPTSTTAAVGSTARVNITAVGDGLTYTWYFKNPGSSSFTKSGVTSSTYTMTMQPSLSGREVYCVVTDKYGNTEKSNTVKVKAPAVKITTQPKTTYAKLNGTASVTIAASGEGLKYEWYFKNPGSSTYTKSSVTSSTYSMTMLKSLSGRLVYCMVTDKYGNKVRSDTVSLNLAVTITKQPTNTTVPAGQSARVSITATGDGLKYAWYFKNPGSSSYTKSGVTSSTYTMTMQSSLSGRQVYCVVTDKYGKTAKSNTVKIKAPAVKITTQPKTTYAKLNGTINLSVAASGDGIKYAWYFKNPGNSTYTKSSITSSTYTMTMKESLSGRLVYCMVTDKYGNKVRSNTVNVCMQATITKQPASATVSAGKTATISITAAGEELRYAWYFKNPDSSSFTRSGVSTSTYTMTMHKSLSGRQVYCVVTDKYGKTAKSNTVTIKTPVVKITTQPKTTYAKVNETAKVTIAASGDGLKYTWYFKNPGSSTYTKSGITSSTYSVTMQNAVAGRKVYCVVADKYGNSVKSNTITLCLTASITTQPKSAYAKSGDTAKISVAAAGDGLTYTWYFKNPGSSSYTKSGITASTYSVTMQSAISGRKVYCVVADKYGNSIKSDTVTLYINATITKQPTSTSATVGSKATVSVTAAGNGLTYTWYFKNPGSSSYTKSSITSSTYTMTMQESLSGRKVYCVVTDKKGNSVRSNTVTLTTLTVTVKPVPGIDAVLK